MGGSKGEQNAVTSSRSADGSPKIEIVAHGDDGSAGVDHRIVVQTFHKVLAGLPKFLTDAGTYATHHPIRQKAFGTQRALYQTAEHPQREHVEEQMGQAAVKKHITDELPHPEVVGQNEVKAEQVGEVDVQTAGKQLQQVAHHVGYQQVAGDRGKRVHKDGWLG